MNNHSRRLAALEGQLAQRERLAAAEDLRELVESVRAKLLNAIARYERGEPIPEPIIRHDGPHHAALRRRLSEMRGRLERYAELRDTYGIR
jgi:hypothetical protein